MTKVMKIYLAVRNGGRDENINFNDLRKLLIALGFSERIKGDHHLFTRSDIPERINIQPNGSKAKGYQVEQIRNIIKKYGLEV